MEVTDKKYADELEFKMKKEARKTKRWIKRQNGVIGKIVSFKDNLKNRSKENISTVTEKYGYYGRANNRVYIRNETGHYILFKKFKNSTKAKKFMKGIK